MEDSACFTFIPTNSLQMSDRYRSLLLLQIPLLVKFLNPGRSCIQNASFLSVKMFCILWGDCKVLSIVCWGDDHHERPVPPNCCLLQWWVGTTSPDATCFPLAFRTPHAQHVDHQHHCSNQFKRLFDLNNVSVVTCIQTHNFPIWWIKTVRSWANHTLDIWSHGFWFVTSFPPVEEYARIEALLDSLPSSTS